MPWVVKDAPFGWTLEESNRRSAAVLRTVQRITARLSEERIPYALIGGMALVAHGFVRFTDDVDVLTTPKGLEQIHERLVGRGYRPAFPGARKKLRDTETGVDVEFITSGEYPGDGKPKAVRFPDPRAAAVMFDDHAVISLETLIELKLASGLSAPHRLNDLADVQRLIEALGLPREFANQLDSSVRDKYLEYWDAIQRSTGPDKE